MFFSCLGSLFIKKKTQKINPNNKTSMTPTSKRMTLKDREYYELTKNIINYKTLTQEEIDFIENLPPENLIEIIKYYNKNIININMLFKNLL